MEEKIQKLYEQIREIAAFYLIYQLRDNIERTSKIIPEIQEFVLWFLEENRCGVKKELYQGMCNNLLIILKDILFAMENRDVVLLHDSMAGGLMEYLQLFVKGAQEEKSDENL